MSAHEAVYGIFEFKRHWQYPNVLTLAIHLENEQYVIFDEEKGFVPCESKESTLTAFFRLCNEGNDDFAQSIKYLDLPKYYTFDNQKKKFLRRKRTTSKEGTNATSDCIGYIPGIANQIKNIELYSLYLLILHTKGPRGFKDIRIRDGVEYPTYKDCAIFLGLLISDQEAYLIFDEISNILSGKKLIYAFCDLLINYKPEKPLDFYNRSKDIMLEEVAVKLSLKFNRSVHNISLSERENYLLSYIKNILISQNHNLSEFLLPEPQKNMEMHFKKSFYVDSVVNQEDFDFRELSLNSDQKRVYNGIISDLNDKKQSLIFLNAAGGTGKTYLINCLIEKCLLIGKKVVACASSGIASQLLIGGNTLHSKFNIPTKIDENSFCRIEKGTKKADFIKKLDLLIWDESPMFQKSILECLDRTFRDLRNCDKPFGGISMFLSGDFRQILPVVKNAVQTKTFAVTLKKSYLWDNFRKESLLKNMRLDADSIEFQEFLLELGNGKLNSKVDNSIEIPDQYIIKPCHPKSLCDSIYANFDQNFSSLNYNEWVTERCIICSNYNQVDVYNN